MKKAEPSEPKARIFYARTDEFWRKGEKYAFLEESEHVGGVEWQELEPDAKHNWLKGGLQEEYESYLPIGDKGTKEGESAGTAIWRIYSRGCETGRDKWVYNFTREVLLTNVERFVDKYNEQVHKLLSLKEQKKEIDEASFIGDSTIKWSRNLKQRLAQAKKLSVDDSKVHNSIYRPFSTQYLYFDYGLVYLPAIFPNVFPTAKTQEENKVMCVGGYGRKAFAVLVCNLIPNMNFFGDPAQCFPFYTYNEDSTNRRENITDWALEKFRAHYGDKKISKWDIFHYVYALLHHPVYRERYAANLKRELPRIPFVGAGTNTSTDADCAPHKRSLRKERAGTSPAPTEIFWAFAEAGTRLAEIHVNYEQQPEYPLEQIENPREPLNWRVERMKLSKDKTEIVYNSFLTLAGIPAETFEYRLGNRSALEWVIDQYQLSTDKRSGITNDPNRADDPQYIVRLIGQVINVSLETTRIVRGLPDLGIENA